MRRKTVLMAGLGMALLLGSTAPAMTAFAQEEALEAAVFTDEEAGAQTVSMGYMEFEIPADWICEVDVDEYYGLFMAMPDLDGEDSIELMSMEKLENEEDIFKESFAQEDTGEWMSEYLAEMLSEQYNAVAVWKCEFSALGDTALGDTYRIEIAVVENVDGEDTLYECDFYFAEDAQRLYIIGALDTNGSAATRLAAAEIVVGARMQ